MTKRDFMIQFVLNRATAVNGNISGRGAALEAENAWNVIQIAAKPSLESLPSIPRHPVLKPTS